MEPQGPAPDNEGGHREARGQSPAWGAPPPGSPPPAAGWGQPPGSPPAGWPPPEDPPAWNPPPAPQAGWGQPGWGGHGPEPTSVYPAQPSSWPPASGTWGDSGGSRGRDRKARILIVLAAAVVAAAVAVGVVVRSRNGSHYLVTGPTTTVIPLTVPGPNGTLPPDTSTTVSREAALSTWLSTTSPDISTLNQDLTRLSSDGAPAASSPDNGSVRLDAGFVQTDVQTLTADGPPPTAALAGQWSKVLDDLNTGAATLVAAANQMSAQGMAQGFTQLAMAARELGAFANVVDPSGR